MTLTRLDSVWIMFENGFVLYREVIQIVTVMQVPASQIVVASQPCSLFDWNDNVCSVTNGFVK
jgi:hypothetical protein